MRNLVGSRRDVAAEVPHQEEEKEEEVKVGHNSTVGGTLSQRSWSRRRKSRRSSR